MLYSDRYFSTDWQFEMFKRGKANVHDTCLVYIYISKYVSFISVTYVSGTHWNSLIEAIPMYTYNIYLFNTEFFTISFFKQLLNHFQLFKEMSM